MTYITNADIEEWLGAAAVTQLTDDAGAGSIDADKVTEARIGAEGEANSYLAARYAVPVNLSAAPEVEAVLRQVVLDLAGYRLHGRRPPVPPDIIRRREEAVAWLGRVAAGTVQLPAANPPDENPALGIIAAAPGPPREMTRASLRDL